MGIRGLPAVLLVTVVLACADTSAEGESEESSTDTGDIVDMGDTGDDVPFDYCEGLPPDAECYAQRRDPNSDAIALAQAIADRHMQHFPPTAQTWDWEELVFMFSLTELHRVTGEARYQDHYRAWIDYHIDSGYAIETSDTCAPVAVAAALYAETGDAKYRQVLDDALTYFETAVRSNSGGLSHFGTYPLAATLWVDSLFMFGNVMTRWGELLDDQALFDELAMQFEVFTAELQAPGGFYVHAWNWPTVDDSVYWGRGNGWVTTAGYDYQRALVLRGQHDEVVGAALALQVDAIVASQDPSGLWWIVLNYPGEAYLETSTSALFAYGLARGYRYGLLDGEQVLPVIDAAMAAIGDKIVLDEHGLPVVTDISGPTGPGALEEYAAIPLEDDLGYGVGAVILALIESSGLPPAA